MARALLFCLALFLPLTASAYYEHRLSIAAGIERYGNPASTDFLMGAEYEYRFMPVLGVGGILEYLFANPGVTRLGLPVFVHPLSTDWLLLAAPIVEISGGGASAGARLGTRVPIPLGGISLIPSLAVDFINGNENLIFGLGIEI